MKTMNALTIDHVSLSFDDFRAVDDVSFSVKTGEFITLLGPSGCGKTTLLKLIGGFYQPDSGKILIDGSDVTKVPPERRDTTMCFQSYALFPHLTVAENIVFGLKQKKIRKDVRDERLREVARQVALETQLSKLPSMLSGGQQQRVALARAMAMRSGIILFDEPLSNLDAKLRDQVRFEMLQLQKSHGFTAIYVTHDQSEALAMSDTIIVLNRGRIEQIGTPDEIYKKPKNRFIADFIGTANIFEARIAEKIDGRRYIVETSMGRFAAESENPPQSDKLFVCWRPEDAVLTNTPRGENDFVSHVEVSVYQGNKTDLLVRMPEGHAPTFRIQTAGTVRHADGARVSFHIPAGCVKFLEATS